MARRATSFTRWPARPASPSSGRATNGEPQRSGGWAGSALRGLATAHDWLTGLGFALAKGCLVVIVSSYTYETVARYFFSAPTWWSNEVVGYALCIGTFLAMPELTRRGEHIAITFAVERLGPSAGRRLAMVTTAVSGLVCLFVAWLSYEENVRQLVQDVMLVRVEPIPKVWISSWITYGFLSSGVHFLRAVGRARAPVGGPALTSRA